MKNIHVLPTDKPTRLFITDGKLFNYHKPQQGDGVKIINQNIYITSDEEIKEGDWYLDTSVFKENITIGSGIYQMKYSKWGIEGQGDCKKIILTTDQALINDGVQAIDDEFLEWFVKNPSCEYVKVNYEIYKEGVGLLTSDWRMSEDDKYKIIIPKEEPKQETLEEVAEKYAELSYYGDEVDAFVRGAKWQAERMYSEEDIIDLIQFLSMNKEFNEYSSVSKETARYFLEQFKKK